MKTDIDAYETVKARGLVLAFYQCDRQNESAVFTEWVRFVEGMGIENDSPSTANCTQLNPEGEVGVLSWDNVTHLIEQDSRFEFGQCRENICVVTGDLSNLKQGDFLHLGRALLVVTRIGRICDRHCRFSSGTGESCPISKSWAFASVVKGGQVCVDDCFLACCHT